MSPTLHLDTNSIRSVAALMNTTSEEITNQTNNLQSSANSMNWISQGRAVFDDEFIAACQQINSQSARLQELAQRVESAVRGWETAAASLSGSGAVLGVTVEPVTIADGGGGTNGTGSGNYSSSNLIDEVTSRLWDGAKAVINTAGFITKNTALKNITDAVGGIDFFFKKMPETEKAFRAWEDYNRITDGWDAATARQLQENAKKHLEDLGLSGIQDAIGTVTDTLGDNKIIREAIVHLKDAVSVATDWLGVVKSN